MAFDLSFGSLESARERLTRMRDDDGAPPDAISKAAKRGIHIAETLGASFGFAWLQARFEKSSPGLVAPLGVPIDLLAGAGLTIGSLGLSLAGVDLGGWEDHMAAVGTGAFAVYTAKLGVDMGVKSAAAAAGTVTSTTTTTTAAAKGLVQGGPAFHVHPQAAVQGARRW